MKGINVANPKDIEPAIKAAIRSDVSTVINVMIDEESNILPMLPPGGHVKDAFGGCMIKPGDFEVKK